MLGLARTHARSPLGTRVGGIKPFYRGAKVTAIGAISSGGDNEAKAVAISAF